MFVSSCSGINIRCRSMTEWQLISESEKKYPHKTNQTKKQKKIFLIRLVISRICCSLPHFIRQKEYNKGIFKKIVKNNFRRRRLSLSHDTWISGFQVPGHAAFQSGIFQYGHPIG